LRLGTRGPAQSGKQVDAGGAATTPVNHSTRHAPASAACVRSGSNRTRAANGRVGAEGRPPGPVLRTHRQGVASDLRRARGSRRPPHPSPLPPLPVPHIGQGRGRRGWHADVVVFRQIWSADRAQIDCVLFRYRRQSESARPASVRSPTPSTAGRALSERAQRRALRSHPTGERKAVQGKVPQGRHVRCASLHGA
jgi:hypothetical protein